MSIETEIHHLTMAIAELAKALAAKSDVTQRQTNFDEDHKVVTTEAPKGFLARYGESSIPEKVEAPKVEAPKVEAPKVEAPKVEAPKGPTREELRTLVKTIASNAGGNEKARSALNSIAVGISVSTCPEDRLSDLQKALQALI